MKNKNKCENKIENRQCRNEWQIDCMGKKLCDPCWERRCEGGEQQ